MLAAPFSEYSPSQLAVLEAAKEVGGDVTVVTLDRDSFVELLLWFPGESRAYSAPLDKGPGGISVGSFSGGPGVEGVVCKVLSVVDTEGGRFAAIAVYGSPESRDVSDVRIVRVKHKPGLYVDTVP